MADVAHAMALAVIEALRDRPELRAALRDALDADAQAVAEWLSPEDVAERVGVSRRTVYRALNAGHLEGRRAGARWRVPSSALSVWPPPDARADTPTTPARRSRRASSLRAVVAEMGAS